MQIDAINKIRAFFRRNYFNFLVQKTLTPVLACTAFLSALCVFVKINIAVWYFLSALIIFIFFYISVRSVFLKIDIKDCYRELDRVLDLKERAVTYYELKEKKHAVKAGIGAENESEDAREADREMIISFVGEDFIKNYNRSLHIFDNASEFDKTFKPFRAVFTAYHYRLLAIIFIFSLINLYFNYYVAAPQKNTAEAAAEHKEVPVEAAGLLDALIESNADKLKAADAFIELKAAREKLKEPQTSKQLSEALREAADNLRHIKEGENKKGVMAELSKISQAADEMISGKSGEGLNDEDKKMLEDRLAEFKKLVDDYLKNSNDKDFARIEKELSELTRLFNAKKEAMKKAAADNKTGAGNGAEKKENAENKWRGANETSSMKHLNRMSGKELLEKLKNDKQLQELYAALSAMSDEASASNQTAAQLDGGTQDGAGGEKEGKKEKGEAAKSEGGKDGEKKGGQGGKITPEALGINIPKPGKGSSNLKAASSDAPLMAPQERQKALAMDKNAGQWKAFFEAERFNASAKKSKVEGIHDSKTPTMSIEGRSLPEPGEAETEIGELIKSETSGADSMVSSDKVPDELKKSVGDYFKKLNNDFSGR